MQIFRIFRSAVFYALVLLSSIWVWIVVFKCADGEVRQNERQQARNNYLMQHGLKGSWQNIEKLSQAGLDISEKDPQQAERYFITAAGLAAFDDPQQQGKLQCYAAIVRQRWIDEDFSSPICNLQPIFDRCKIWKETDRFVSRGLSIFKSKSSSEECGLRNE